MRDIWVAAADLVLGARCVACGRPAMTLCRACADVIVPDPAIAWPTPVPPLLRRPAPVTPVAAGPNADVLRRVLIAWKESGATTLTPLLAHHLAASVLHHVEDRGPVVLVPVPTSRRGRRERGTDLVGDLASAATRLLRHAGVDARLDRALTIGRATADQVGLGAEQRAVNRSGAFRLRRSHRRRDGDVIVVDDILTTGSTVAEVVRVLSRAGRRPIGIAVVAATPRIADRCRRT